MTALTAKAALVDPATIENEGGQAIATRIPRSQVEEAARAGGPAELWLDLATVRDGEREAEQRVTLTWEPDELQQLLNSTTGEEVLFAFKPDELARMFDDVEAHGLREKLVVLTVAATAAAGISAGVANAMVMEDATAGGTSATTPAFVTDTTSSGPAAQPGTVSNFQTDTTSSGPAAQPGTVSNFQTDATSSGPAAQPGTVSNFVTDTTSSGPKAVNIGDGQIAPSTGGDSFLSTAGGMATLAGGLALLILGAGFVGVRHRGGVQPA